MDWRERLSLRFLVLPLAKKRLATLEGADRPLPFPNGVPGSTNGVAALKLALDTPLAGGGAADAGIVSIPDLSYRAWRTDLLVDGIYAAPGAADGATNARPDNERLRHLAEITTFFTVPSMGVHPDKARNSIDDAVAIFAFLRNYEPQRFPGRIDPARAARGQTIYAEACASCHGAYTNDTGKPQLMSFPNWHGDVGTDRLRADMFDTALVEAVRRSPYRDAIVVRPGRGYVAPPLGGLWASAPYLHNGSVPSLSALLSPDERPRKFMVGGHALDFNRVGVLLGDDGSYPAGYKPFSKPVWIDTDAPGLRAEGHRFGEQLSADQKRDLIEYLKLL
jgi:cytochrome c5